MNGRRTVWLWPMLGLLGAAACNVDDRGLSFTVNALGSASSGGSGEPQAGEGTTPESGASGGDGTNGGTAGADQGPGGTNSTPEGGAAPSSAGTSSSTGGTDPGPDQPQGTAGEGAAGSPPIGGGDPDPEPGDFPCGNLNRNAVDDCQETQVQNSRFDTNALSWTSEASLLQTWKPDDARGKAGSGSLLVSNTNVIANGSGYTGVASYQCITAWTGDEFEVGARVRIAAGQGSGEAGVNLLFFGDDGCSGPPLGGQNIAFTSKADAWVVVKGRLTVPAGTRSARVRLMVSKPFPQASLEAQFDDVLVVKL